MLVLAGVVIFFTIRAGKESLVEAEESAHFGQVFCSQTTSRNCLHILDRMYEIALSVNACVRSGTRADIVWMISSDEGVRADNSKALALTPGGGRIGALFGGAFDRHFLELANRQLETGRKVEVGVSDFESTLSGLPLSSTARFLVVPARQFSAHLWPALLGRKAVALVCSLDGDEVISTNLYSAETISTADPEVIELFEQGISTVVEVENQVITVFWPVTKLVIAGAGSIAESLSEVAKTLGWQVAIESRIEMVSGLMAGLSEMDCAVIMGHDVESSSRCLAAALESDAGYIGALGSRKMQENRADWLAYRDVFDLSRVNGPAGLDIGASSPGEIAISILAQAIARLKGG
jgi:xanthine dehydrogenase accessory factor